ncbi:Protein p13 MTCP-1 [Myotis brandtii]|uniref:Protein p13 MTCP-1 n=1 Tax=Myotis brandtii TaxID=109478 RepID=S7MY29_MYOBR|nr:PREDICTED: protein p13 MTCP-1 [Myotis brandtii]EPQ09424.1 Protein p13 MTCP-1 [Myotis brandtii]
MAELPLEEHLNSHPMSLRRGHSVYEDENERTWLPLLFDIGGVLQVCLCQKDIPSGDILLTTNPLTSSTLPWMWTLHPEGHYLDPMFRFWRIVHHVKKNGMEELILELIDDLSDM